MLQLPPCRLPCFRLCVYVSEPLRKMAAIILTFCFETVQFCKADVCFFIPQIKRLHKGIFPMSADTHFTGPAKDLFR